MPALRWHGPGGDVMPSYYNEIDPYAAAWLRNLITAGQLPAGDVDERSIVDVRGDDLRGYGACHFFAGIGGWAYALRLAGVPDEQPIWTGSCPCQPFSVAGSGKGTADERHLWPAFRRLIAECKPAIVFGEQVASADGRLWLAGVRADLEALGYGVGAADLCAAGVSAPHIRQRLYWLADAGRLQREGWTAVPGQAQGRRALGDATGCSERSGLADADGERVRTRLDEHAGATRAGEGEAQERQRLRADAGDACGLGDTVVSGLEGRAGNVGPGSEPGRLNTKQDRPASPAGLSPDGLGDASGPGCDVDGPWHNFVLIPCGDGKSRRIEPGATALVARFPFVLADGRTVEGASRTGILKGIGNSIVPPLAAEFVRAAMEATSATDS